MRHPPTCVVIQHKCFVGLVFTWIDRTCHKLAQEKNDDTKVFLFFSCLLCSVQSLIAGHLGALVVLSLRQLSCDRLLANGSWHLSGHMRSTPAGISIIGGTLGAYGDCDRWLTNYSFYNYLYFFGNFSYNKYILNNYTALHINVMQTLKYIAFSRETVPLACSNSDTMIGIRWLQTLYSIGSCI